MDRKTESFFLKISYYRSFGFIIAGIVGFLFSLNSFTKTIDVYPQITGIINHSQVRWNDAPFDIQVKGKWFSIYHKKIFPDLKEKAVPGKRATIWYGDNNRIVQLIVEGEIVFPYSKATWLWFILMAFGLFLSGGNIYYIIKYPFHSEGKESKPDKSNN